MRFKVVLQPSEDGGFTAIVPALPGCISEGDTKDEALRNIREAIELYLAEAEEELAPANLVEEVEVRANSRCWATGRCSGHYSGQDG